MKKLLLSITLIGNMLLGSSFVATNYEFNCVSVITSCGPTALACGFDSQQIAQDAIFWDRQLCGGGAQP